jgi:hypothetical protein
MRTWTVRPLARLVTRAYVPKGAVLCAATSWLLSKISPLAVRRPCRSLPYQEARPYWIWRLGAGYGAVDGGAAERLVQDATRPVMRRHHSNVRIHPCRLRVAQDLRRLTGRAGDSSRSSPTTAVSTCEWLHIAWLSTVVVCIVWSHSKSIGVYHTREPHTDTIMTPRSASMSVGVPCEGWQ